MSKMSRQTAIVGAGRTGFNFEEHTVAELLAQAAKMAIEDAGLQKSDIDGIITHAGGRFRVRSQASVSVRRIPGLRSLLEGHRPPLTAG